MFGFFDTASNAITFVEVIIFLAVVGVIIVAIVLVVMAAKYGAGIAGAVA
jgi:hypothetical protein